MSTQQCSSVQTARCHFCGQAFPITKLDRCEICTASWYDPGRFGGGTAWQFVDACHPCAKTYGSDSTGDMLMYILIAVGIAIVGGLAIGLMVVVLSMISSAVG